MVGGFQKDLLYCAILKGRYMIKTKLKRNLTMVFEFPDI